RSRKRNRSGNCFGRFTAHAGAGDRNRSHLDLRRARVCRGRDLSRLSDLVVDLLHCRDYRLRHSARDLRNHPTAPKCAPLSAAGGERGHPRLPLEETKRISPRDDRRDSGRESRHEPGLDLFGVISEGTGLALVGHDSPFIEDVKAFRPPGIESIGRILDRIDSDGHLVAESLDEVVGDGNPLGRGLGLRVTDLLLFVGVHLPFVGRMGFLDVDSQESDAITVLSIHPLHTLDRAPERRSSEAAEDEDNGLASNDARERHRRLAVEPYQRHIRSAVAGLELAFLALVVTQHADKVSWSHARRDKRGSSEYQGQYEEKDFLQHSPPRFAGLIAGSDFSTYLGSSRPAPGRLPRRHARARPSRVRTGPSLVAQSQIRLDHKSFLSGSFAHRLLRKASVAGLTVLAVATRPTEQGGEVSFCTLSHKAAPVWKVCGAQSRSDCLRRQSVAPDE